MHKRGRELRALRRQSEASDLENELQTVPLPAEESLPFRRIPPSVTIVFLFLHNRPFSMSFRFRPCKRQVVREAAPEEEGDIPLPQGGRQLDREEAPRLEDRGRLL